MKCLKNILALLLIAVLSTAGINKYKAVECSNIIDEDLNKTAGSCTSGGVTVTYDANGKATAINYSGSNTGSAGPYFFAYNTVLGVKVTFVNIEDPETKIASHFYLDPKYSWQIDQINSNNNQNGKGNICGVLEALNNYKSNENGSTTGCENIAGNYTKKSGLTSGVYAINNTEIHNWMMNNDSEGLYAMLAEDFNICKYSEFGITVEGGNCSKENLKAALNNPEGKGKNYITAKGAEKLKDYGVVFEPVLGFQQYVRTNKKVDTILDPMSVKNYCARKVAEGEMLFIDESGNTASTSRQNTISCLKEVWRSFSTDKTVPAGVTTIDVYQLSDNPNNNYYAFTLKGIAQRLVNDEFTYPNLLADYNGTTRTWAGVAVEIKYVLDNIKTLGATGDEDKFSCDNCNRIMYTRNQHNKVAIGATIKLTTNGGTRLTEGSWKTVAEPNNGIGYDIYHLEVTVPSASCSIDLYSSKKESGFVRTVTKDEYQENYFDKNKNLADDTDFRYARFYDPDGNIYNDENYADKTKEGYKDIKQAYEKECLKIIDVNPCTIVAPDPEPAEGLTKETASQYKLYDDDGYQITIGSRKSMNGKTVIIKADNILDYYNYVCAKPCSYDEETNTYYDSDSKPTSREEYKKVCGCRKVKETGNKTHYYGPNNEDLGYDESKYNAVCPCTEDTEFHFYRMINGNIVTTSKSVFVDSCKCQEISPSIVSRFFDIDANESSSSANMILTCREPEKCDVEPEKNMPSTCSSSTEGELKDPTMCSIIKTSTVKNDYKVSELSNKYCNIYCRKEYKFTFMDRTNALAGRYFQYDVESNLGSSKKLTTVALGKKECVSEVNFSSWLSDYNTANQAILTNYNALQKWYKLSHATISSSSATTSSNCSQSLCYQETDSSCVSAAESAYTAATAACECNGVAPGLQTACEASKSSCLTNAENAYTTAKAKCTVNHYSTVSDDSVTHYYVNWNGSSHKEYSLSGATSLSSSTASSTYSKESRYYCSCPTPSKPTCVTKGSCYISYGTSVSVLTSDGNSDISGYVSTYESALRSAMSTRDNLLVQLQNCYLMKTDSVTASDGSTLSNQAVYTPDGYNVGSMFDSILNNKKDDKNKIEIDYYENTVGGETYQIGNDTGTKPYTLSKETTGAEAVSITYGGDTPASACTTCNTSLKSSSSFDYQTIGRIVCAVSEDGACSVETISMPKYARVDLETQYEEQYYQGTVFATQTLTGKVAMAKEKSDNQSKMAGWDTNLPRYIYPVSPYRKDGSYPIELNYKFTLGGTKLISESGKYTCSYGVTNDLLDYDCSQPGHYCPNDCVGEECGSAKGLGVYFRTIDLKEVFPNTRSYTTNWYNKASNSYVLAKDKIEELGDDYITDKEPMYVVDLTSSQIRKIKNYNNNGDMNYLNNSLICDKDNPHKCTSLFLINRLTYITNTTKPSFNTKTKYDWGTIEINTANADPIYFYQR